MKLRVVVLCATAALLSSPVARTEEIAETATAPSSVPTPAPSPLERGFYLAPMASYVLPYSNRGLDNGLGGTLGFGYRYGLLAVEAAAEYARLDAEDGGASAKLTAAHAGLLLFPFDSLKGFYGVGAVGRVRTEAQPAGNRFEGDSLEVGAGYIFPLSVGRYAFGLRSEARARFSERSRSLALGDDNQPRRFQDVLLNLGLHLPFGLESVPPPPPPVQVVAPVLVCSDGQDNDGDGLIDFPNDPGCSSADDQDESDPKHCSDGKDNDGDGLVDFAEDKGCEASDDDDEEDPCKKPVAGQRISLKGCGMGDIVVLRGVNFDFDRASLTANAKSILDNVAEELNAYPDISVELSGHTDSRGSDEYNQRLSDLRSASVKKYLVGLGVAEERMTTIGIGETQPVADNDTDEGRELNRRVELKITEGVALGGPPVTSEAASPGETQNP